MPAPQGDDHVDDVDPTGIRDLLAALPDPGPMPEDLVRRIEARLEVERAHQDARNGGSAGAFSAVGDSSPVARADNVFDLAAERSHRRPARTVAVLGAAAAGLLVTTVAVSQLVGAPGDAGSGDTAASYPSLSRADSDSAEGGAAADGANEPAQLQNEDGTTAAEEAADEAAADSAGSGAEAPAGAWSIESDPELGGSRLGVLPDLGTVTVQDLVPTLSAALTDDDVRFDEDDLTLEQARSCWSVLAGHHEFDGYVAARAQFVAESGEALPAVTLLGIDDDGTGQMWVMPTTCAEDPQVAPLSGPHPFA